VPRESRENASVYIARARDAWDRVGGLQGAERDQAIAQYDEAVSHLFDQLRCVRGDTIDERAARMGTVIDESRTIGSGLRLEDLDAIVPSSQISTSDIGARHTVSGAGVPVVGWRKTAEEGKPRWEFEPPTGVPLNLTALLKFAPGKTPVWSFTYPGKVDTVTMGSASVPLAADWSAPSAFYWEMSDLDDLDIAKALLPSRFSKETKLFLSSPYDPNRIPLVLVHGLNSSPGTFKRMYNELNREPWFRKNYQVWFYSYPTGNNWLYNAAVFREEMATATKFVQKQGPTPNWDRMVVVGHSMGGVITSASLKKPEYRIYDAFATKRFDQIKVSEQTREAIRLMTMYEPLKPPSRVVFMAAPLKGSPLADRFFSAILIKLIQLPKNLTINLVDFTLNDLSALAMKGRTSSKGWFTSIGSLSPEYPAYKVLEGLPYRRGIKINTIIGDRGKGDTPNSSDGIVPYWSSHIDGAESEKIVPSGHSVTASPEAAVEIERILKLHLGAGATIVRREQRTSAHEEKTPVQGSPGSGG
jgi:pimeloyl-ACP methyl ester carboxylesterase